MSISRFASLRSVARANVFASTAPRLAPGVLHRTRTPVLMTGSGISGLSGDSAKAHPSSSLEKTFGKQQTQPADASGSCAPKPRNTADDDSARELGQQKGQRVSHGPGQTSPGGQARNQPIKGV
eukprot:TRINITY_DN60304_c0_g1_i1.p2 TRINITY_DN60304_c0_g1~~TRINITY_DN60304_c0_g1_i1.p2  ORF type:complete len:124 (-),score=11.26 TRINITY_DN60304_c0_g1_i1:170-541(-)